MKNPFPFALQIAAQLRHRLWAGGLCRGKPCPSETWDEQYLAGAWDYLESLEELDRYSAIAGYVSHYFEQADILDLGCGHGHLLTLLHPRCFKRYTGVDLSQVAISRARRLKVANARFLNEDFEIWTPDAAMDAIVFNESLYYGNEPVSIVTAYLRVLKAGGKVIISMEENPRNQAILRNLDRILHRVHGVHLRTARASWMIRIFEPIAECRAAS